MNQIIDAEAGNIFREPNHPPTPAYKQPEYLITDEQMTAILFALVDISGNKPGGVGRILTVLSTVKEQQV